MTLVVGQNQLVCSSASPGSFVSSSSCSLADQDCKERIHRLSVHQALRKQRLNDTTIMICQINLLCGVESITVVAKEVDSDTISKQMTQLTLTKLST